MSFDDPKSGSRGQAVVEFAPVEFLSHRESKPAGGPRGVRVMVKFGDFLFPFSAQGCVFAVDGSLAAMVVLTADSDRLFWNPVIRDVFGSLQTPGKRSGSASK